MSKFLTDRLTVGYLSPTDPHKDRFGWSGTYFNTCKAIEDAGYKVEWIPSEGNGKSFRLYKTLLKILYRVMFGKGSFENSSMSGTLRLKYISKLNLV